MAEYDRSNALKSIEQAPFSMMLGLRIESADNGEARARMPLSSKLLNDGGPGAPIHGGAIAALADFAACAAVWTLPDTVKSVTISMTVNYTGPGVKTGLVAHARVRSKGRRIASLTVEITDDAGALVAHALVSYKIA